MNCTNNRCGDLGCLKVKEICEIDSCIQNYKFPGPCQLAGAANVDQYQTCIPFAFSPRARFLITSGGTEETKLNENPLSTAGNRCSNNEFIPDFIALL